MYHSKVAKVVVPSGGSATVVVGVPPCRFAGSFYGCEPDGDYTVLIVNRNCDSA